jgi:manganese-transporting P-type ATPase
MKAPAGVQEQHVEFDFRRVRFELDFAAKTFRSVRFPDSNPISSYLSATGFASDSDVLAAMDMWGTNTVNVPVPHFMEMLKEQMLAPFFCFQVFCVLLWCMDAYWYYSLFTLFMLVMFECTVVLSRTRTLTDLRSIQVPKQTLQVRALPPVRAPCRWACGLMR